MDVTHPEITVRLSGTDGNIFAILGKVKAQMKAQGYRVEADNLMERVMSQAKDYDHALRIIMETVNVE